MFHIVHLLTLYVLLLPNLSILDFEYDVSLIFKNCEKYNGAKGNTHMVLLGRHTAKAFR